MRRHISSNLPTKIKTLRYISSQTPTPNTFSSLTPGTSTNLSNTLQHYINSNTPKQGLKIHTHILKTGYNSNTNISIKLLILHLKCGTLDYARQMLDEMQNPTLSACNYMINAYVKNGLVIQSFDLLRRMVVGFGVMPDGFTLSLVLKGWGSGLMFVGDVGRQVHAQVVKCECGDGDVVLYAALIDSYVKSGRVRYARGVFDGMDVRNVVCYTSLICGYLDRGNVGDAEVLFREMVEKDVVVFNAMIEGYSKSIGTAKKSIGAFLEMLRLGFCPTVSTFASLIGACSLLTSVEVGRQVQSHVVKTKYFLDVKIGSALIDMYCKCGETGDARRIFDYMPVRNVFSWTSIIDGYGKNGMPNEVIEVFSKMQEHFPEIRPNYVTFLCALSACAHAGFVDRGWEIFQSMERDYFLKPRMEHYACMVDLFGRIGDVQQAWDFVKRMPEKPNSDVWAALLSSCLFHGELDMARIAAAELFQLGASGRPGSYLALSNALAAAGRWDCVNEVRELMKMRGVAKDTGLSWTKTDDCHILG